MTAYTLSKTITPLIRSREGIAMKLAALRTSDQNSVTFTLPEIELVMLAALRKLPHVDSTRKYHVHFVGGFVIKYVTPTTTPLSTTFRSFVKTYIQDLMAKPAPGLKADAYDLLGSFLNLVDDSELRLLNYSLKKNYMVQMDQTHTAAYQHLLTDIELTTHAQKAPKELGPNPYENDPLMKSAMKHQQAIINLRGAISDFSKQHKKMLEITEPQIKLIGQMMDELLNSL